MGNRIAAAQAEANRAHEQAETPEAAHDAYCKVYQETLACYERAERILEAKTITSNGSDGQYYVESQSGNGRYLVRVERVGAPLCNCPDFKRRGFKCKHIIVGELYEVRQGVAVQLLAWADELEAVSWYDAILARKIAKRGLATEGEREALAQLRAKYDNELLAEVAGEQPAPSPSNGKVALDTDGYIIERYCRVCKTMGPVTAWTDGLECLCGHVVEVAR